MLARMMQLAKAYFERTSELWSQKAYARFAVRMVLPPVFAVLLFMLLYYVVGGVAGFLHMHASELAAMGLLLWGFAGWLDEHKAKRLSFRQREMEERERREKIARMEYAATQDRTYTEQGKIIFTVARELGALGIIPPTRLSNIFSPSRTIAKEKGAFFLALFLLQKDRETVDVDLLRETLQMKIDQRLMAGDFPSIDAQHIYDGRVYSGFVVDYVRDSQGFVEVYTVLVDDAYCRYRQARDLMADLPARPTDLRDMEF